MNLSDTHKQYLLREQIVTPALINIFANGAISWLVLKNADPINYWKATPIGSDLLLTALLLPFIMCMINSRLIAGKASKGDLELIPTAYFGPNGWHTRSILVRSLCLGALGVLLYAVPTVLILPTIWPEPLQLWGFVIFKALWAAVLAVLVSPVIAVWAIQSVSEESRLTHQSTDRKEGVT